MAYQGNVITPPVSIRDVQQALGSQSTDLGTLCVAGINKWARYKPVRVAGPLPVAHGSATGGTRTRYACHFGLEVPYCHYDAQRLWYNNVMNGMVSDILYGNFDAWEYLKPRGDMTAYGGVKEYYRLTDFVRMPDDDTDPYYNTVYAKGYNSNARVPFVSWIDMAGVTLRGDGVYQVNKQVANSLTILFQNSIGDELHLQDFITLGTDAGGRAWRPVLQVFNDAQEYDPATGVYEDWDNRDFADKEACGDPITADAGGTVWSVSLDLSDFESSANTLYHLCVGMGYVNSDFSSWGDTGKSLFVIPYQPGETPFYYKFAVVSYQSRKLTITGLRFFENGAMPEWKDATGAAPYFTINSLATDLIRLTMTITKDPSQALDFIPANGTPDAGFSPLRIQARETIQGTSGESNQDFSPTLSSWQPAQHVHISTGATTDTETLYAEIYIGNIPVGGYGWYHVYAYTGATDQQGDPVWDNIGYFSIHKVQYSNS